LGDSPGFPIISRWAIALVFQLLDIRREPGLSPFGYQFVSLNDIMPMCLLRDSDSDLLGSTAHGFVVQPALPSILYCRPCQRNFTAKAKVQP
jgi:hypothetical protein